MDNNIHPLFKDDEIKSPDEIHEDGINSIYDIDDIQVYHSLLIADLDEDISHLDDRDVGGHLWLNRFRTFLTEHYRKYNQK